MNKLQNHELTHIWYTLLITEKELTPKERQLREEISEILLNRVLAVKGEITLENVKTGL